MIEGLFQPLHLIVILVVILIVFGPGKLPELGAALGKGIREFQRGAQDLAAPVKQAAETTTTANTAPAEPKACQHCGAAVLSGHRFCPACGTAIR